MSIPRSASLSAVTPAEDHDTPDLLAAIDLGSNSFHMVVAQRVQGEIRTLEKMGEKVQLGAGLDARNYLTEESQQRALECLRRFSQRIQGMAPGSVRVVGTNALRVARNAQRFVLRAEAALGCPVEIIAGREEARIIYLGVAHTLADDLGRRLVVDIGGGSTEFIIGERFEPQETESLHMGCVSFRNRYFNDGRITRRRMQQAITHARQELLNIQRRYRGLGWQSCVGSSGSIKAIENVLHSLNLSSEGITLASLKDLRRRLIDMGRVERLEELGVREDRQSIFPAGFAILYAAFESLGIEQMHYADGALREGLLYDMVGRSEHEDVRERTISALQERYRVDTAQAEAVERSAQVARSQVASDWALSSPYFSDLLRWASRVHEVGLAISHTQYHKHGGYLLQYSDLPGFSQDDQAALATLVRSHRRKFSNAVFETHAEEDILPLKRLAVILRLAVLLQHGRNHDEPPPFSLSARDNRLTIEFEPDWLEEHPLTRADLESERRYLSRADMTLMIRPEGEQNGQE